MQRPYVLYTTESAGAKSQLFKLAAQKNNEMLRTKTVEEHRILNQKLADLRPIAPNVAVKSGMVGGVPCEWITRSKSRPDKIILYIHGGSWAFGSLDTARPVAVLLTEMSDYSLLVVDYRLSPEHPYPAGLEDCCAVYRQLLRNGFSPGRIALLGDSAGGNLILCMLHVLFRENTSLPAAAACASPVTDLTEEGEFRKQKPDLMFTRVGEEERDVVSLYLAGKDPAIPTISPVRGDMAGFPPVLIHVGEDEALCGDNIVFADHAHRQGALVTCKVWKDMFHAFSIVGVTLKESRRSLTEIAQFFDTYLRQ